LKDAVNATLAALGVVGQIAIVLLLLGMLAWAVSPAARRALAGPREAVSGAALWLSWVVAAVATGGSLYVSEIADFVPCQLCWYQRICMYPLSVTLLVGALLRDRRAGLYSIVFPVVGALVSIRHIYIEINPDAETASCKIGAPCSVKWIEEYGYVTIPVLALTAFTLIGLLLALDLTRPRRGPS
jgi:disulfide bond formation protein DsbB